MSAHDVTFAHRRFTLMGGMTADFKKAAMNSHPLINSIRVLSCKEAGSDKEVLAWSEDVNWDAFNWAGARVKLFCDGWVNEFVVEDSGASPENVIQDKGTFDVMFAANMTVEKSLNVEHPENSNDYLSGLMLCLWQPIDTSGWTYPFFSRPRCRASRTIHSTYWSATRIQSTSQSSPKHMSTSTNGLQLGAACRNR